MTVLFDLLLETGPSRCLPTCSLVVPFALDPRWNARFALRMSGEHTEGCIGYGSSVKLTQNCLTHETEISPVFAMPLCSAPKKHRP